MIMNTSLYELCSSGRKSAPSDFVVKLEPTHVGCYNSRVDGAWARTRVAALALSCCFVFSASGAGSDRVTLVRTPEGGIQPQAAVDSRGTVHLIYYKGGNMKGDVFHVRQPPGQTEFSKPIQVNTRPGSAMAAGTIRGLEHDSLEAEFLGAQGGGKPRRSSSNDDDVGLCHERSLPVCSV